LPFGSGGADAKFSESVQILRGVGWIDRGKQLQPSAEANLNAAAAVKPHTIYYLKGSPGLYIVPSINSPKSARKQITEAITAYQPYYPRKPQQYNQLLANNTVVWLWIVVENPQNWKDVYTNVAWLTEAIDTIKKLFSSIYPPDPAEDLYRFTKFGIRTSASEWQQITGGSTKWHHAGLWYANPNGQDNLKDFIPFGGWTRPLVKTYNSSVSSCTVVGDQAAFFAREYPDNPSVYFEGEWD